MKMYLHRSRKSRKTSQFDNLQDCFNRLWLKSDPVIRKCFGQKHCSRYTFYIPETNRIYRICCKTYLEKTIQIKKKPVKPTVFLMTEIKLCDLTQF